MSGVLQRRESFLNLTDVLPSDREIVQIEDLQRHGAKLNGNFRIISQMLHRDAGHEMRDYDPQGLKGTIGYKAIDLSFVQDGDAYNKGALGAHAFTLGRATTASGAQSIADGTSTTASGDNSKASGNNTTASGVNATASGNTTLAAGENSTADGLVNGQVQEESITYAGASSIGTGASSGELTALMDVIVVHADAVMTDTRTSTYNVNLEFDLPVFSENFAVIARFVDGVISGRITVDTTVDVSDYSVIPLYKDVNNNYHYFTNSHVDQTAPMEFTLTGAQGSATIFFTDASGVAYTGNPADGHVYFLFTKLTDTADLQTIAFEQANSNPV